MAAFHGSDLEKIEQIYGIKKEEITGFGANVNPLGLSPFMKDYLAAHLDVLCAYPDRNYTALRRAIADYTGADAENIMVGNGSTELISAAIQAIHPHAAVVLGPAYSEYERELTLAGSVLHYYDLCAERISSWMWRIWNALLWNMPMVPRLPEGSCACPGCLCCVIRTIQPPAQFRPRRCASFFLFAGKIIFSS